MLYTSISVCILGFSLSAVKHGNRHDYNFIVCFFGWHFRVCGSTAVIIGDCISKYWNALMHLYELVFM